MNKFHGSDGVLDGAMDFTRLSTGFSGIASQRKELSQENAAGSVSKNVSIISTKTLATNLNKFHGSDGVLDGAMDFTRLSTGFSDKGFQTKELSQENAANPLPKNSVISTKTLATNMNKFHGSDGVLDGVMDFTRLDTGFPDLASSKAQSPHSTKTANVIDLAKLDENNSNIDWDAQCDRVQYPLYQNMSPCANAQQNVKACPPSKQAVTTNNYCRNMDEDTKRKSPCSHDNQADMTKYVDFDLLRNEKHETLNKSVTSTKTITTDNCQALHGLTKGATDLRSAKDQCNLDYIKFQKSDGLRNQSNQNFSEAKLPKSCLLPLKDATSFGSLGCGSDQIEISHLLSKNENHPNPHRSQKTCRCQRCFSTTSISEPNIEKHILSKDLIGSRQCCKQTTEERKGDSNVSKITLEKLKDEHEKSDKSLCKHKLLDLKRKCNKTGDFEKGMPGKNTEFYSSFDQNCDSCAEFHKIFAIDGIGLECRCCISSFKYDEKK